MMINSMTRRRANAAARSPRSTILPATRAERRSSQAMVPLTNVGRYISREKLTDHDALEVKYRRPGNAEADVAGRRGRKRQLPDGGGAVAATDQPPLDPIIADFGDERHGALLAAVDAIVRLDVVDGRRL